MRKLWFYMLAGFCFFCSCQKDDNAIVGWEKICESNIGSNNCLIKTSNSNIYYFWGSQLRRSSDNGKTWITITHKLPSYVYRKMEVVGSNVFLGSPFGLYYSTDNGNNWSHISIGDSNFDSNDVRDIVSDGSYLYILFYNNFYRLDIEGKVVKKITIPTSNTHFNNVAKLNLDIYVSTDSGIYKSSDNGLNWININNKITLTHDFISSNNCLLYQKYNSFYISLDKGVSWNPISVTGVNSNNTRQIICLGTNYFARCNNGIYMSNDNCKSWSYIDGNGLNSNNSTVMNYAPYNFAVNQNYIFIQMGSDLWAIKQQER